MSVVGRLLGRSRPSMLDDKVEAKIAELTKKSEELSERVQKKLTTPPDALDKLIDLDRVEQELRGDVKELKNTKGVATPEIRKDLKEIKADVKEIKEEVKK